MRNVMSSVLMVVALTMVSWAWSGSTVSAQESEEDVRVVAMRTSPDQPSVGDQVEVTVTVVNFSSSTVSHNLELAVSGTVVGTQTVQFEPKQSREVLFSFTASSEGVRVITVGAIEQSVQIRADQEAKMRVGTTVRLQASRTVVKKNQDALIDIFWDNSSLNEKDVMIEVLVQVPTGLYLHSEVGAMSCSAGTCKGLFTAPPGSTRNMPIIVKADAVGDYFLNLNGRYWPKGNPDGWNPVNLSTPIYVREVSENPESPGPAGEVGTAKSGTPPVQPASGSAPVQAQASASSAEGETRWWLEPQAMVLWLVIAFVLVVVVGFVTKTAKFRIGGE